MYTKQQLRQLIRNKKRQFTQEQLNELSLPIIRKLLCDNTLINAETILMYYSLSDEVNTHEAIDELLSLGKKILLPVVINDQEMEIREYTGIKDLKEGSYQIKEPTGKIFTDYKSIDVAVIPGMSFDKKNNRLGRGKGYYDRFLKSVPNTYKIGICFDFQKQDEIPTGEFDVKMSKVL